MQESAQLPKPTKVKYRGREHTVMAYTSTGEFYTLDNPTGGLMTVKASDCEVLQRRTYPKDF